jgi:elongation factor G
MLADKGVKYRVAAIKFPEPVLAYAIEPKSRGDEDKINQSMHRLEEEDPSISYSRDLQTKELLLSGQGQLHIEVTVAKLKRRFGVDVNLKPPRIPYRETITASADGFHRHKKQTGGAGQFGEVSLRVEPMARGTGFEFVDSTKGGVIPHQFMPAVRKGVEQVLGSGAIAGFPMHDVRVVVYDGKHHPVDSKEVAFVAAGRKAFLDAIDKARPIVLEPIVTVEVICPDVKTGDIAGDLSSRRGQVTGTKGLQPGILAVSGLAPLAELEGYSARLKSVTGGQGSWTMQLSHYEPAPPNLQQQLATEYKKSRKQEED